MSKRSDLRFDPYDFVESCIPECTSERHAYHQGQWDMAGRINQHFGYYTFPGAVEVVNDMVPVQTDTALTNLVTTDSKPTKKDSRRSLTTATEGLTSKPSIPQEVIDKQIEPTTLMDLLDEFMGAWLQSTSNHGDSKAYDNALESVYQLGLDVIGPDHFGTTLHTEDHKDIPDWTKIHRNELRAEQRKAWKAICYGEGE